MKLVTTATPNEVNLAPILLRGPLAESFALASQYGCDAIEVHLRDPHDVDWEEMVELSRRYSLPVTTLGTGMAAGIDGLTFTDPEAGVRIRAVERVKEHIRLAARLGSAVTIGVLNGRLGSNLEQAARCREHHLACLKECCQTAADAGVYLLLEPLNRYECDWFNTTEDALSIIAQLGFANLKYLADTFHMNIEEVNIAASIRRAGNALGYIHLVDSNRCGPGQGHLPFDEVLNALVEVGYDGYLSLECFPKPDAERAIKNSLSYIKTLLAEVASRKS
ncbi:MAG: sugar phosphate isomerase/epimerase family protein [Desulfobacterales bacterium]|jgi:sugar phosphate isomerase/epimerase